MNIYQIEAFAPLFFLLGIFYSNYWIISITSLLLITLILAFIFMFFKNLESNFFEFIQFFSIQKILVYTLLGSIRSHYIEKVEPYTYRTTYFHAKITDIRKSDETYYVLSNFKYDNHINSKIKGSQIENADNSKIDTHPTFPQTAYMKLNDKIKDCESKLIPGTTIHAKGRFFLPIPHPLAEGVTVKIPSCIVATIEEYDRDESSLRQKFKNYTRCKIDEKFTPYAAQLFKAIFLADTFVLNQELRKTFQNAGIVHLIGVSVLNIAIITTLFYVFIKYFLARLLFVFIKHLPINVVAQIIAILATTAYTILIGTEYPLLRSVLMSSISLISLYVGGKRSLEILLISAMIILCIEPKAIYDLGFQFSFASVVGITSLSMYGSNNTFSKLIKTPLTTTFCAFVATALLSAYHFSSVCLQPFTGNLMAIPLVGFVITPLNLLWTLFAYFDIYWFTYPLELAYQALIKIAELNSYIGFVTHVDPIDKKWPILILLSLCCYHFIVEKIRYIFIILIPIYFLLSIYTQNKRPFILINNYCIGYITENEIIAYPKVNFMAEKWRESYNTPCFSCKEKPGIYQEKKSGKIVIANKVGIYINPPKCVSKIPTKNYIYSINELCYKTHIIKL